VATGRLGPVSNTAMPVCAVKMVIIAVGFYQLSKLRQVLSIASAIVHVKANT
jgi:hypothetical protein